MDGVTASRVPRTTNSWRSRSNECPRDPDLDGVAVFAVRLHGGAGHLRHHGRCAGGDRAFTAALIASASTIANLIPPSIMAVVYGATGNVSIGGLFLAGVVPGVMIGIGLMIYSYFFGPTGILKKRAALVEVFVAARG